MASLGIDDASLSFVRRLRKFEWLPSREKAARDFDQLKIKILARDFDASSWTPEWLVGLQKKYRPSPNVSRYSPIGRGMPKRVLGVYFSTMSGHVRHLVTNVLLELKMDKLENKLLLPALKLLKEVAFHHGDDLFPGYYFELCDMHNLFGAQPEDDEALAAFDKQVEAWVSTRKPEDDEQSERTRLIERGLEITRALVGVCGPQPTFDEWVKQDDWVTSGASTVPGVPGAQRTKASTVAHLTKEELQAQLHDKSHVRYKLLIKRERTKLRNLVTAPFSLHMQMSFVGSGLERKLWEVIPSSLKKDFGLKNWIRWHRNMTATMYVPIDQSKFDHVPSGYILNKAFKLLCEISTPVGDKERESIASILLRRLQDASVEFRGKVRSHSRGVLSGWRWTSVIDTLINFAEHMAIAEKLGVPVIPGLNCYQGDDTLIASKGWDTSAMLVEEYNEVLPVNPDKFFTSAVRTEYLRLVLLKEGTSRWRRRGYPARAVMSLMYANAWAGGTQSAAAIVDSWSRLAGRVTNPTACFGHCISDLCGLLRCTRFEAKNLIKTPKSRGGLGYGGLGVASNWVQLVQDELIEEERIGARRVNDWDLISPSLRKSTIEKRTRIYEGDILVGEASARALLKSLKGLGAHKVTKAYVRPSMSIYLTKFRSGKSPPPPPRYVIPASTWSELVIMTKGRVEDIGPYLLHPSDVSYLTAIRKRFPRWLYLDWLTGRFTPIVSSFWGASSDVIKYISTLIAEDWRPLPSGRVKTEDVRGMMLFEELLSVSRYSPYLLSFGG